MHDTAIEIGKVFFDTYLQGKTGLKIADIGAQDVNGSLRSVAPANHEYIGVDFVEGKGVDVILTDPYTLPFEDKSLDVIVCSSCFEHSEFFWLLFNEVQRVLKDDGLFYLNVPSNGAFHRYPVDCWRFYPDSGLALERWAKRSGYNTTLLESFTGLQKRHQWNDFIAVYVKDGNHASDYTRRMQDGYKDYTNGWVLGAKDFTHPKATPEDKERGLKHCLARLNRRRQRQA